MDYLNPFTYACMLSVEIALLMLNSDKILPSTINDVTSFHPFKYLVSSNNTNLGYLGKISIFKLAMSSNKFLEGCTETEIFTTFHGFLMGVKAHEFIQVVMNHEKLTSAMIEQFRFKNKTIMEYYCVGRGESLKILLESNKLTVEFALHCLGKIDIGSLNAFSRTILENYKASLEAQ